MGRGYVFYFFTLLPSQGVWVGERLGEREEAVLHTATCQWRSATLILLLVTLVGFWGSADMISLCHVIFLNVCLASL